MLAASMTAAPAAYIFKGNIAGTLDGNAVSGLLTLTATGDTNDVAFNGNAYTNFNITAVFDLAGVGSFTILEFELRVC